MEATVLTPKGPRTMRGEEDGSGVVADAHARYYEAIVRGNAFVVANQTGVTSQAGLSGTTPVLTLYNPAGSGVNGVVLWAGAFSIVAVAAGMMVWLAANTNIAAAAVTGTATSAHRNLLLGNGKQPSLQPLLAATLPTAPVAIAMLGDVPGTIALNSQMPIQTFYREVAGGIILAPGSALSFQTSTASGTSGLLCEVAWEEVPIL